MRLSHSTVNATMVHQHAHQTLTGCLDWKPFRKSVPVSVLVDLVLLMAATGQTLFGIVRRRFDFSHETARQALRANLPDMSRLTKGIVDSLHQVLAFSRRDRRRRWTVAIDIHNVPFYGDRSTPGIVGGPKKQGTKYSFSYATAVLIHRRRRYTVAMMPILPATPVHEIVATLLDQIRDHGLQVGGVVLDSGFDSGDTILLLQERGHSYTVPLRRKGKGTNRRNEWFALPHGTIQAVDWVTDKTRKAVTTTVLVWKRKDQKKTMVFAFGGWGNREAVQECRRAWLSRRRYRERFGIETSYRQKNQARAWTTSCDSVYRMLLEGLAHLLRQLWVRLTEQIARICGLKPTVWIPVTFRDILECLADHVKANHPSSDPILPPIKTLEQ
jgi:hypothetical protein